MKEYFSLKKEEKGEILAGVYSNLKKQPEIVFAFAHGSFLVAEGNFRDLDVALYLKKALSPQRKFAYEQKVAELLEQHIPYPVDVRVLNRAPFYFLNNVFRFGKLLFCHNTSLLTTLMEQTSVQAMANYYFSKQSLKELVSR